MLGGPRAAMMAKESGGGAPAVITLDARTSYTGASGDPHTFNHTLNASASLLLVKCTFESAQTTVDVKVGGSGGTSLTKNTSASLVSSQRNVEFWTIANPTESGSVQIWIDLSGGDTLTAEAVSYFDVDTSNPFADAETHAVSATNTITMDAALVPDGTCWLEVATCYGGTTPDGVYAGSITTTTAGNATEHTGAYGWQADVIANVTPQCDFAAGGNDVLVMCAVLLRAA